MHTFRSEAVVDRPVDEVFAWHERPGALRRLLPPWEPITVVQEAPDLTEGAEAVLRLSGPKTITPRWVSRHTGYRPPHEFTDVQVSGPFAAWRHRHAFEPAGGGCRLVDEVTYDLPLRAGNWAASVTEGRLRRMFAYRHRQVADDLAAHAAAGVPPMTVVVTGASGFVGGALAAFLSAGGHRVIRLVRRAPRVPDESAWDPERELIDAEVLRGADAVVHLAGASIGGRFTDHHKESVRRSRVVGTRLLARTLARLRAEDSGPRAFVTASAIGYYGADRGAEPVDEESGPGSDFLAEVCREWEAATGPAREAGVRVAYVRTGVVQSPAGGVLRLQLPQFWSGLGGRLGSGEQWLSWISLDDIVGVYHHVLTRDDVSGPVNGVAPAPVTNAGYTATLGRVLRRPTLLPTPAFGPRLLLGDEGAELTAFASQNVHSGVLVRTGYRFRQPDLESCLRHVLGRVAP
ncbi:MAG TPA: TIGR01777 family oxidoreductase [Actinocatenispora sp.]